MNNDSISQLANMLGQGMKALQGNPQLKSSLLQQIPQSKTASAAQQETTDKINNLIQQANASISCGPTCQKENNISNLQQLYLNAQENVQSAPDQLKTAERNYFVAAKGQEFYDNFLKKELSVKANALGDVLTNTFQTSISNISHLAQIYNSLFVNYRHVLELHNNYVERNTDLEDKIKQTKTDIVTNDRKTYYEVQHAGYMQGWYHFFKWIYIILLFVFLIAIFAVKSSYSIYSKVIILALLVLYPFVIDRIVLSIMASLYSFYMLLPKNVYTTL